MREHRSSKLRRRVGELPAVLAVLLLVLGLCASGCATSGHGHAQLGVRAHGPKPHPHAIWMKGHWSYQGGHYHWVKGHWKL